MRSPYERPQYSNQGGPKNPYWHGHKKNGGYYEGGTDGGHYVGQGYGGQGYDNQGYENQGYENQGYENQGYENQGYENQGYEKPSNDYKPPSNGYQKPPSNGYGGGYFLLKNPFFRAFLLFYKFLYFRKLP